VLTVHQAHGEDGDTDYDHDYDDDEDGDHYYDDDDEEEQQGGEDDSYEDSWDRPEYQLLHFQSEKIQAAMEKALARPWPIYLSCGISVELACHTGFNDMNLTDCREATNRMFLILQVVSPIETTSK
jgi:hypothetical protein